MFYHILLSLEPEPTKLRSILVNLSERELMDKFLVPYRKGKNIVCANEIIPVANIRKLHIVRTARDNESERVALQERSFKEIQEFNRQSRSVVLISPGRGYDPEDILEVGEDVTNTVVAGPPGHASSPNPVIGILSNPWVVAIGTGLIVAAVVWWLGWS